MLRHEIRKLGISDMFVLHLQLYRTFFGDAQTGSEHVYFHKLSEFTPVCFGAKARMVVMAESPQKSIPNHELTFG